MSKYIFDYDDGDFAMSISDSMAMDSDGNLMMAAMFAICAIISL